MKLITVLIVLMSANVSFAQFVAPGTLVKRIPINDRTTPVRLELNTATVKCLLGDYSATSLKISVPQLNQLATFNHTTAGETLPCINAGPCKGLLDKDGPEPKDILDKGGPTEAVDLRVLSEEVYYMDETNNFCYRSLVETVTTKVRGLDFMHQKEAQLVDMPLSKCKDLVKDL